MYHIDPRSDYARLGIVLYGLKPDYSRALGLGLEPVMELKACVSQVKTVEAGVSVQLRKDLRHRARDQDSHRFDRLRGRVSKASFQPRESAGQGTGG